MTESVKIDHGSVITYELPDGGGWHRIDGPAVIWGDGDYSWYIDDHRYNSIDEYLANNDFLSEEEKVLLKLEYG